MRPLGRGLLGPVSENGVEVLPDELVDLPVEVVLSDRLRARLSGRRSWRSVPVGGRGRTRPADAAVAAASRSDGGTVVAGGPAAGCPTCTVRRTSPFAQIRDGMAQRL